MLEVRCQLLPQMGPLAPVKQSCPWLCEPGSEGQGGSACWCPGVMTWKVLGLRCPRRNSATATAEDALQA